MDAGGGCWACNPDAKARAQEIVLKIKRFLTAGLYSSKNWTELERKPAAGNAPDRTAAGLLRHMQEQSQRPPEEEQTEIKQDGSYRCIVLAVP